MEKVKEMVLAVFESLKRNVLELLVLTGAFFIAVGVFMIFMPAGFIITGLMLVTIAYLAHVKGGD